MAGICIYAIWKGGLPERIVSVAMAGGSLATRLLEDRVHWLDPQWGILSVDAVFFLIVLGLALRTDRSWMLFATAFALLQLVTHLAMFADNGVHGWAYLTALIIWSYLILFSLGIGTLLHTLDRRFNLHYP
jgi:hypothetical protein